MDTARGRWFLAEFARRNRTADTTLLLSAIERLESMLDRDDSPPAPHEPVTTRAITSSAASELFAVDAHVEPALLPAPPGIPSAGLPDDGNRTWVIDEPPSTEALREKSEDEDDDILLPADGMARLPPLLSASSSGPRIERPAPLQSAMLAAALAQAEETMARAAEPEPPAAPSGYSPSAVDPSELDALSFEEKSVYFA